MNSAKLAVSLGAVTLALSGLTASAATNVVSDPVGFYKIAINPGVNPISAPLQKISVFKGTVAGVIGNTINFTGTPSFTPDAFDPITVNASARAQYVAIVCNDADKASGAPDNITGDWFTVSDNAAGSVTVVNDGSLSLLAAGDQVEIRKLSNLADLFGAGASSLLVPDPDGGADRSLCDVVSFWLGLGFGEDWTYINAATAGMGNEGYYISGDGPYDGSQVTFLPNQPFVYFRRSDQVATNICVLGLVQSKPLTHYLVEGPNAISAVYPATAPLVGSGLEDVTNWVADIDGSQDVLASDVVSEIGSSLGFLSTFSYVNNGMGTEGWFDGTDLPSPLGLQPGKNYFVFVKSGTGGRKWRQPVPFAQ
jgi:hypothetical protein